MEVIRGEKAEAGALGLVTPFTDAEFRPKKLLRLATLLRGTGLCDGAAIVLDDLLDVRLGRLPVDWLRCTDEAGVEELLLKEFKVEEDLLGVGPVPFESVLVDASGSFSMILRAVFFLRSSLKKGMSRCSKDGTACAGRK